MTTIATINVPGVNPGAAVESILLTVPVGKEYAGTLRVCHSGSPGSGITKVTVSVVPSGGITETKDRHVRLHPLSEGELLDVTFDLSAGSTIRVESDNGLAAFNFMGIERTL